MSHDYAIDNLIKTDAPADWAGQLSFAVRALMLTARLSLENDGSGICNDSERDHAAADTLEVAMALMDIVIDGADQMQRSGGHGSFKKVAEA
ncbi:hypothetical protein PANO111632_17185 [Paracoccus nototheniae]|uniref:DUF3077 domain-containing protein n=1 Tax=Paracoccus nototheniae TaxID=2489002 RepID=A0ABW4DW92_9RHOB|nr:hypothetical protein [Paracoccus nototheniae]